MNFNPKPSKNKQEEYKPIMDSKYIVVFCTGFAFGVAAATMFILVIFK